MEWKKQKEEQVCKIYEQIEELNRKKFMLNMKDRFSDKDFEQMREYDNELIKLKKQLEETEKIQNWKKDQFMEKN